MLIAVGRVTLSPGELSQFRGLLGTEQERKNWLFGRIAGKDAVRILWREQFGEKLFPADIQIEEDSYGCPTARPRPEKGAGGGGQGVAAPRSRSQFPTVAFASMEGLAIGVAAFTPFVGVAMARNVVEAPAAEETSLDAGEKKLLDAFEAARTEGLLRLRCAKKAVATALGNRLPDGARSLKVRDLKRNGLARLEILAPGVEAFPDWPASYLRAWTVHDSDLIVATTFCEREPR